MTLATSRAERNVRVTAFTDIWRRCPVVGGNFNSPRDFRSSPLLLCALGGLLLMARSKLYLLS